MTKWEKTGIDLRERGAFTLLDHKIMTSRELRERRDFLEELVNELEQERDQINDLLLKRKR